MLCSPCDSFTHSLITVTVRMHFRGGLATKCLVYFLGTDFWSRSITQVFIWWLLTLRKGRA